MTKQVNEDVRPLIAAGLLAITPPNVSAGEPQKTEIKAPGYTFNDFVEAIIYHENLVDYQTPFRITSEAMKKWKTIHGFEIDQNFDKPADRKNFIFLKNKDDVEKAVKKQIQKYVANPSKYGLPSDPTMEDIIKKFDQTGSKGKIKLLKHDIPSFDEKAKASTIVKERFEALCESLIETW